MDKKKLILLAASLLSVTIWGCSSNLDSGDDSTAPGTTVADAQVVGSNSCKVCHTLVHTTEFNALAGQVTTNSLGITHECEACHGGGEFHRGIGPIPYPAPDAARCGVCHEQVAIVQASKHNSHLVDGTDMIASGYNTGKCQRCHTAEGSREFAGIIGTKAGYDVIGTTIAALPNLDGDGNPILHNAAACGTCHNPLTKELVSISGWDPNGNLKADQFDMCTSCHVYDDKGTLYASGQIYSVSTAAGGDGIWFTADDTLSAGTSTTEFYHNTSWYRVIASTHYDNPDSTSVVEGYVIRKNGANPCFDCHGHETYTNTRYADTTDPARNATSTIYTDWAQSAHAGGLLKAKYAVARTAGVNKSGTAALTDEVMGVGVNGDEAPWPHYDWDKTSDTVSGDRSGRAACQRCHTATGAANFMNDPANYDPANNDYSHLSSWSATLGSPQNELLYCWGCHSNAAEGVLRNPGAITEIYEGTVATPLVTITYPDVAESNVCMSCHLGRETGAVIKTKTGFDNLSFVNSHYLAAGGSIFGQTGYTYGNRDYSIPASDTHSMIGRGTTGNAAVDANYTGGPCVTCHFGSNDGSHTLSPYTEYAVGDVALNPVCVNCHTSRGEGSNAAEAWLGKDVTLADLVAGTVAPHKGRYLAALEALNQALIAKGFTFTSGYPYFAAKNWLSTGDTDITGGVTGKNNMGAAFNYNLLIHEPGGVAHNRRYTRRLIYDSIDWLDNGALDYSVAATLNALPDATTYKASAVSYLLKAQLGDAGDRY